MDRKVIETAQAPAAIGPYSQGIDGGDLVFSSGQIPLDPSTETLVEGSLRTEAAQVIRNMKAILEAVGSGLDKVIRLDVYLTDLALFPEINFYLEEVFPREPPARVTIGVAGLPMGARIEMAAIAMK